MRNVNENYIKRNPGFPSTEKCHQVKWKDLTELNVIELNCVHMFGGGGAIHLKLSLLFFVITLSIIEYKKNLYLITILCFPLPWTELVTMWAQNNQRKKEYLSFFLMSKNSTKGQSLFRRNQWFFNMKSLHSKESAGFPRNDAWHHFLWLWRCARVFSSN